jgi:flagellar FliJ protein
MSGVKSFLLAIDLATRKRDDAAQSLVRAQNTLFLAQDQMAQLETYAAETESKWTTTAQNGTTPEMLRHQYQFMDRLRQAIALQDTVLESENRKVQAVRRFLLSAEFRVASLQQVLNKMRSGMALVQSRREQKQMDEFAAMRSRQVSIGNLTGERS